MPYPREHAGKGGHADFIRNPDVGQFLTNCSYLREPSDTEAQAIAAMYQAAPIGRDRILPKDVLASDASKSDAPINGKLPSTQVGFLKISHVLIRMDDYNGLQVPHEHIVNPYKVAAIHRNAHPVTFTMPGSNIRYKGHQSVKDGFRQALFDQLSKANGPGPTMVQVLVRIHGDSITIRTCPACKGKTEILFSGTRLETPCGLCHKAVYATDSLRLHEGISDFGDNASAMTRMMNAIEHLMLAAFILEVQRAQPNKLS